MNEFIVVNFAEDTPVYVDGIECGTSNAKFIVETGTHTFDLGPRPDYAPRSQTATIVGATAAQPYQLQFWKV